MTAYLHAEIDFLPGGIRARGFRRPWSGVIGGKRGKIHGFSDASRRRLTDTLMEMDWCGVASSRKGAKRGRLVVSEQTYPAEYSADWKVWKRHKEALRSRLERAFPGFAGLWKLEFQERGAPHFHLVLILPREVSIYWFRRWVSLAWYEIVGSGDEKHLVAGTSARIGYGRGRRLMLYLIKYLGKGYSVDAETGRCWGVWGELPGGEVFLVRLSWASWVAFTRRLRRWGRRSRYVSGVTARWSGFRILGELFLLAQLLRGLEVVRDVDVS